MKEGVISEVSEQCSVLCSLSSFNVRCAEAVCIMQHVLCIGQSAAKSVQSGV